MKSDSELSEIASQILEEVNDDISHEKLVSILMFFRDAVVKVEWIAIPPEDQHKGIEDVMLATLNNGTLEAEFVVDKESYVRETAENVAYWISIRLIEQDEHTLSWRLFELISEKMLPELKKLASKITRGMTRIEDELA